MINDSKLKFLVITDGGYDMLCNSIFHGLVNLGHEVIDYKYVGYMTKNEIPNEYMFKLYGFGFTFRNTLPESRAYVDRSKENVYKKINDKYFDYIIYCMDHKKDEFKNEYFFDLVYKIYPHNRIIFLDSADFSNITLPYDDVVIFKRELVYNTEGDMQLHLYPIQYSIPESYFIESNYNKNVFLQDNIRVPGVSNYYKFDNEEDYKKSYLNAFFGLTRKKMGWDCLRHYEIIACECLPFFDQYNDIPISVMTKWPRELQIQTNKLYHKMLWSYKIPNIKDNNVIKYLIPQYRDLLDKFYSYAKQYLTTTAMAQYLINTVENIRRFE